MAALGAVLGLSLVFVGVNYPLDILIGGLLGFALGETGRLLAGRESRSSMHAWRTALALW